MPRRSPPKQITRKRLNNALAELYRTNPSFFQTAPTKMSFLEHVKEGNVADVREFLEESDFNINVRDEFGRGCLHFAMIGTGGLEMVRLLVENGADINMMDFMGIVPIYILSEYIPNFSDAQLAIFHYLIDNGALLFPGGNQISYSALDFGASSIESKFVETFDVLVSNIGDAEEDENSEEADRLQAIFDRLDPIYTKIQNNTFVYVRKPSFQSDLSPERNSYQVDIRMTGAKLREFVQRSIFHNPRMGVSLMIGTTPINDAQTLQEQGVSNETLIRIVILPSSGVIRRRGGGMRKTRRRRN